MAESKQDNTKKNAVRKSINKAPSSAAKKPKSVVKKTTQNGGQKQKPKSEVTTCPNPEGLNQKTYESARDAMHIYCRYHPEKVVAGVEAIMKGVAEGNPAMIKLWIDIFGGPEKQKVELSGSVENKQRSPLFDLSIDEIRKLKALKGLKK